MGVAAICLCLALVGTTLLLVPYLNEANDSEFYVLDSNRQTVAYPTNVTSGSPFPLILSFTNHENTSDTSAGTVSLGNSTLYRFNNLTLIRGQNVERPRSITLTSLGEKQKLKFALVDSFDKTYELHRWGKYARPDRLLRARRHAANVSLNTGVAKVLFDGRYSRQTRRCKLVGLSERIKKH
jgi:uncharacterized membrane protein